VEFEEMGSVVIYLI